MIESHNRKKLFWKCKKDPEHVFTTERGIIPFECPLCKHRYVQATTESWYNTMKDNQQIAFKNYQLRNNDWEQGAYGRFMWRYCNE